MNLFVGLIHQQNLILPIESRQTHRLAIDVIVAIDSHRLVIDRYHMSM